MKHLAFLGIAALLLLATSQVAGADLITNKYDPAFAGSTVIDFDDQTQSVVGDTVTIRNVTFTDLDEENVSSYSWIAFAPNWDGYHGISGLSVWCSSGELEIEFTTPVSAFGAHYQGKSMTWYVYDESGALLEELGIAAAPYSPEVEHFVGVSGERIKRVVCIIDDLDPLSQASIVMDNFRYVQDPTNLITHGDDPRLDGSTVLDFNDLEYMWSLDSLTVGDITWTDLDDENIWEYTRMKVVGNWDGVWGMSGYQMVCCSGELEISFASPVSAFGMNYGGKSSTWYVYDEDDVLIGTYYVHNSPPQPYPYNFAGVSGERIKRVVCILNDLSSLAQASIITDNFEYVVAVTNTPPIADAGADQDLFLGDAATLTGSGTDTDGDTIAAHAWAIESAPETSTAPLTGADTAMPGFTPDVAGTYVLSLVVYDGKEWSLPDTVTLTVALNLHPVAVAAANTTSGDAPLTVLFDGTDSADPEGEDLTWSWDFGDGSDPSALAAPSHTYSVAGDYVAILTVTDDRDQSTCDEILITVLQPNRPPTAHLTATPATGYAPLTVSFESNAADADDDDLTFAWDFDDTATSTDEDPIHTFTAAGTYDVALTVSDGEDSIVEYVAVVVAPGAELTCESVRVKWRKHWGKSQGKEKGTADVRIDAALYVPGALPADTDLVTVYLDGTLLVNVPFGDFREEDWGYGYNAKDVLIQLDFDGETLKVFRRKVVMTDFDPSNGGEVIVQVGLRTDVETVPLEARGNGNLLVYDGR